MSTEEQVPAYKGKGKWDVGEYDQAQICLNGHIINRRARREPHRNLPFCQQCGQKTITECQHCKAPIPGTFIDGRHPVLNIEMKGLPSCCGQCGKDFPWTEKALDASIELFLDELQLQGEEEQKLRASVEAVVHKTPEEGVAASRLLRWLGKCARGTQELVKEALKTAVSEATKKALFPGS